MLEHGRKHEECDLPWVEKDHVYSRRKLPESRALVERTGVSLAQVTTLVQTLLPLKMDFGHLVKTNSLDYKDQDIPSEIIRTSWESGQYYLYSFVVLYFY